MWDERISTVRALTDAVTARDTDAALEFCHPEIELFSLLAQLEASPYSGFAGIRRYFKDDAAWEEWRVEVEQLFSAPDGRVAIVMSTHMRGKGSGLPIRTASRSPVALQGREALASHAVPRSRRRATGDANAAA